MSHTTPPVRAAQLSEPDSGRASAVLFVTYARQRPSDKRIREVTDLDRRAGIRLDVVAFPTRTIICRGGLLGPFPIPSAPTFDVALRPAIGTLDGVAAATGGRVWLRALRKKIAPTG